MGRPLVALDLPFETLPSEREVKQGAALLALLQQDFGPLPIGLAQAPRTLRKPPPKLVEPEPGALPDDVRDALLCPGAVVELTGEPGSGGLSVALRLAHEAWRRHPERFIAAVAPGRPLFAPALVGLGLPLSRLLVVDPEVGEWPRFALRVTRSGAFAAVIVDATGSRDLSRMPVPIRRLALAAEETGAAVLLLTSASARRAQALPVAVRVHAQRAAEVEGTLLDIEKHRGGVFGALVVAPPDDTIAESLSAEPAGQVSSDGKPRRKVRPSQARGARGRRRREGDSSARRGDS